MKRRTAFVSLLLGALAAILGWRMIYPPDYIDISDWFARPIATVGASKPSFELSANPRLPLGHFHLMVLDHARQGLDRSDVPGRVAPRRVRQGLQQLPHAARPAAGVPGARLFRRRPLDFGAGAQSGFRSGPAPGGGLLAARHVRDGKIYGPKLAAMAAPHPTAAWANPNEACLRCHLAANTKMDNFLRQPPCSTVDEILRAPDLSRAASAAPAPDGYAAAGAFANAAANANAAALGPSNATCPPSTARSRWRQVRPARRTYGGARQIWPAVSPGPHHRFAKSTNVGRRALHAHARNTAPHDVPTGAPTSHMTVTLQVMDAAGHPLQSQTRQHRTPSCSDGPSSSPLGHPPAAQQPASIFDHSSRRWQGRRRGGGGALLADEFVSPRPSRLPRTHLRRDLSAEHSAGRAGRAFRSIRTRT